MSETIKIVDLETALKILGIIVRDYQHHLPKHVADILNSCSFDSDKNIHENVLEDFQKCFDEIPVSQYVTKFTFEDVDAFIAGSLRANEYQVHRLTKLALFSVRHELKLKPKDGINGG